MAFRPLIAVIGATGTGKSQLAVDLAKALNGEIINADAMQIYRGLDIITNKHPLAEREGIPHHLMDCISAKEEVHVGWFKERASDIISEIRTRGKLPILVGGTHYYLQELLFPKSFPAVDESTMSSIEELEKKYPILNAETPVLLEKLQSVDPVIAAKWHPRDRRKIRRSLALYYQTGKPPSEIYSDQRKQLQEQGCAKGKFDSLLFWTHSEKTALNERLDKRVEKMIEGGLFSEIDELWELYKSLDGRKEDGGKVDLEKGIWQSIGFKEFLPFLDSNPNLRTERLKAECIERMKVSTRQYAKTQEKWIRTKLMHVLQPARIPLYLLDTTDPNLLQDRAVNPAINISKQFLEGVDPLETVDPKSLSDLAASLLSPKTEQDFALHPELWVKRTCELCQTTTVDDKGWEKHVKSKRHRTKVAGLKKREINLAFKRAKEAQMQRSENPLRGNQEAEAKKEVA